VHFISFVMNSINVNSILHDKSVNIGVVHLKVNPTFATIDLLSDASSQLKLLTCVKSNKTLSNSGKNPGLLKVKLSNLCEKSLTRKSPIMQSHKMHVFQGLIKL
jgi:hypothetical protein